MNGYSNLSRMTKASKSDAKAVLLRQKSFKALKPFEGAGK
jgi:hypothetical protein